MIPGKVTPPAKSPRRRAQLRSPARIYIGKIPETQRVISVDLCVPGGCLCGVTERGVSFRDAIHHQHVGGVGGQEYRERVCRLALRRELITLERREKIS